MNHIPGQQQRDAETAFLRGDTLQLVRDVRVHHVEQGANPPRRDVAAHVLRDFARVVGLDHLTDLFLDRHQTHKLDDSRLDEVARHRRFLSHNGRRCIHTEKSPEQRMCQSSACRIHEVSSPARHRYSLDW